MMHADTNTRLRRRAGQRPIRSAEGRLLDLPRLTGIASRVLAVASLILSTGCGDEPVSPAYSLPSAPAPTFTTEHFAYYVEEEGPQVPCDGIEDWMERYYDAYADFFGVDLPPGQKIEYHLFASTDALKEAFGCKGGNACARGTKIGAVYPFIAHELVHAVGSLLGRPPALFNEGVAEVIGCPNSPDMSGPADTTAPLEDLVETAAFDAWRIEHGNADVYTASKTFVRYLLDRHGAQRFLAFHAGAPHGGTRAEVEAIFQTSFDVSLDAAFAEWRTLPVGDHDDSCLRLAECAPSMPKLASGDLRLGCGTNGSENLSREALLRVEVPADKTLHLATRPAYSDTAVSSVYELHRCTGGQVFGSPEHTAGYIGVDGVLKFDPAQRWNASAIDAPAGEYVVWFTSMHEAELSLELSERGSPMRGADCTVAEEPLALGHDFQTTLASRWVERPCAGPWCPGKAWDVSVGAVGGALEVQAVVVINADGRFSPQQLHVCSEPCPDDWDSCELLELDTETGGRVRTKQAFPPGTVLHLGAPNAPDAEHFMLRLRVAPE